MDGSFDSEFQDDSEGLGEVCAYPPSAAPLAREPPLNLPLLRPLQNPVIPAKAGIQRGWANSEPRLFRLVTAAIPSFAMVPLLGDP